MSPLEIGGVIGIVTIIVLATGTFVLKSAGPLVLGQRVLPTSVQAIVDLLPAALLASPIPFSAGSRSSRWCRFRCSC